MPNNIGLKKRVEIVVNKAALVRIQKRGRETNKYINTQDNYTVLRVTKKTSRTPWWQKLTNRRLHEIGWLGKTSLRK